MKTILKIVDIRQLVHPSVPECQVQWTHPSPVATSAAPSQVGVTVQSFGFQSPAVVSQFCRGPPPLVHASVSPLAITCGDTTPSSDTQEFPCTAQILSMTPLGPSWLQGAHLGTGQTPRT